MLAKHPDPTVAHVLETWAPRMIVQGIDYNDFMTTSARIRVWDDWCREWSATGDLHFDQAMKAESRGNLISAGEAYIAAALCYHFGKFLFQDHHDEYTTASRKAVDAYVKGLRWLDPTAERIEIPFDGATMVGILRKPLATRHSPLVILLPGLDSTKEEFFHWENVFLRRGMATFSLDGPGQGECNTTIRADYEVAVSAALDALTQRDDTDANRIGVAGVSLGGYYAVRAIAHDSRIKAVVENCGPFNWGECWDNLNALTRSAFQYHSGARDAAESKSLAQKLSLADSAQRIKQPLLVIHGKLDKIVPWEQGRKIANAVGSNAEFVLFENGNHVCNNIPYLYRPLTADWLIEKLRQ